MADRTGVPLAQATWNPVTGGDRVSPGCRRCYAMAFAKRLKNTLDGKKWEQLGGYLPQQVCR
jgi:protein gp37